MVLAQGFIEENLLGGFWHTTSDVGFKCIIQSGFIMAEPPIPDAERYGGISFVRSLGGVSVFDFPSNFDFEAYEADVQVNSIGEFIPFKRSWGRSIWLRIDTEIVLDALKSGKEIRALWKELESTKRFMAEIEGAHIGNIPIAAIQEAFAIDADDCRRSCLNHLLPRHSYTG